MDIEQNETLRSSRRRSRLAIALPCIVAVMTAGCDDGRPPKMTWDDTSGADPKFGDPNFGAGDAQDFFQAESKDHNEDIGGHKGDGLDAPQGDVPESIDECGGDSDAAMETLDLATDTHGESDDPTCAGGACDVVDVVEPICFPSTSWCKDLDTVETCSSDGTSTSLLDCAEQHSCKLGVCQPWVCEPGKPYCAGTVATSCDLFGLGPVGGGTDCAVAGGTCDGGMCKGCSPDCLWKQCGGDGCGGTCGACVEGPECAYIGCVEGMCEQTGSAPDGSPCTLGFCVAGVCTDVHGSTELLLTGTIQLFYVPMWVSSVTIEAWGAQGGKWVQSCFEGGKGARMKGTFPVDPGDVIQVIVGGKGLDVVPCNAAFGGGGSFVYSTPFPGNLMIAAGGGGGSSICDYPQGELWSNGQGQGGLVTPDGGDSFKWGNTPCGFGGKDGADGQWSAAGKGWSSVQSDATGVKLGDDTCGFKDASGGFGGGGSLNITAQGKAGGGGGGYSGGGACNLEWAGGGGGGSINFGADQDNSPAVQSGDGKVVISW